MKNWKFENGVEVYEHDFDCSLHCFAVWTGDEYLGTIYPASIEDMQYCIAGLDEGHDPITERWEDGNGHVCNWGGGWGEEEE